MKEVKDYAYYIREAYGDGSAEVLKWVKTERKFTTKDYKKITFKATNTVWPKK